MSRDSSYRLHLTIGLGGFFGFIGTALVALSLALFRLLNMEDTSQAPVSFAAAFTSLAGFAIPVALTFLSYARQVSRCYKACPSDSGFFDCMSHIKLNPLSVNSNQGDA